MDETSAVSAEILNLSAEMKVPATIPKDEKWG